MFVYIYRLYPISMKNVTLNNVLLCCKCNVTIDFNVLELSVVCLSKRKCKDFQITIENCQNFLFDILYPKYLLIKIRQIF